MIFASLYTCERKGNRLWLLPYSHKDFHGDINIYKMNIVRIYLVLFCYCLMAYQS